LKALESLMDVKKSLLALLTGLVLLGFAQAAVRAQAPAQPMAAADSTTAKPGAASANPDQNYVLGPGDVVEVSVLGRSDFDTRARISEDGTIQLPYLGTVAAKDRTAEQLGDQVGKALEAGGYFAKPILKVDIVSFASRYVTVLGEVAAPGLVPIDRPYQLSEILARAGGVREGGADYVIIRSASTAPRQVSLETLATGDAADDPYVSPGDKIFVPKADLFYISGQVRAPGAYPLEPNMTLRMAIGRGGGLTDLGSDHSVKVTSKDGVVRRLGLGDSIRGGDVIVVGEKLF
jgi:polysaccharide export outer membrane protein